MPQVRFLRYRSSALTWLSVAGVATAAVLFGCRGTDARAEPAVRAVGVFPEESHPKILYPVALTASAKPEARKFLDFLLSSEAAPAFEAQGFSIQGKVG